MSHLCLDSQVLLHFSQGHLPDTPCTVYLVQWHWFIRMAKDFADVFERSSTCLRDSEPD